MGNGKSFIEDIPNDESRTPFMELIDAKPSSSYDPSEVQRELSNPNSQRIYDLCAPFVDVNGDACYSLAEYYKKTNQLTEASKYYLMGTNLKDTRCYLQLARIYSPNNSPAAIEWYQKYLYTEKNPESDTYKELAALYFNQLLKSSTDDHKELFSNLSSQHYEKYLSAKKYYDQPVDIESDIIKNLGKCYELTNIQRAYDLYALAYEDGIPDILPSLTALSDKLFYPKSDDLLKWKILAVENNLKHSKYNLACIFKARSEYDKAKQLAQVAEREYLLDQAYSDVKKCQHFLAMLILNE
ncbi:MAG: hypothetical protein Hyperionvirus7_19 [Hyperionvirus sp.]|uniref:Tetratricopeptide repeat protein n=1 Tax=Hyperionvirus sp. TaxID=2487770 RepID=A0A3G5A8B1_9VIRU|nr:MAG: hypothetical protein Hyperionvirus7_19 [Hyperionvirus sp.]